MRAQGMVPTNGECLLYCDHVEGTGEELFHLVCQRDLEGVMAKRKFDPLPAKCVLVEDPQPEVFSMGGDRRLIEAPSLVRIPLQYFHLSAPLVSHLV